MILCVYFVQAPNNQNISQNLNQKNQVFRIQIKVCGYQIFQSELIFINQYQMQTPNSTPLRLTHEQRSRQKRSNQSVTNYKRYYPTNQNSDRYNTIRKYNHRTMSNSFNDSQSDHKNSQISKQFLKSQTKENQIYFEQNDKALQPELSVIEQQQSVVSGSLPIRQRMSHLLPAQLGADFTVENRRLIQTQIKLDQVLDYLRINRYKEKGQLLSSIKNTMLINFEMILQLEHLKQILYLMPDFYVYTQKRDENRKFDLLLALPQSSDLEERKRQFRKRLYQYLNSTQGFTKNNSQKIPSIKFSTAVHQEQKKQKSMNEFKNKDLWLKASGKTGKINPFDAFRPGNSQNFQKMLMVKIKQNEERLKIQKQKQNQIKFGCKQLLTVFDQIPKIFKKREKSSMFKSSIVQDLDKTLNIKQQVICKIFEMILEKYNKFFKIIQHKSGQIIQIQRKIFNQVRLEIEKDHQVLEKSQNVEKKLNEPSK